MIRYSYIIPLFLLLVLITVNVPAQTPPPAPTNLTVMMGGMGSAMLHWDSTAQTLGYKIYKSVDTLPYHIVGVVLRRSFTDFYVPQSYTYHYYVTAVNLAGESPPSDTVIFLPGPPPPPPVHGIIKGIVTDDVTANPVAGAVIRLFKAKGRHIMRPIFTDSLGKFYAAVDTGKFIIVAEKFGYHLTWYDNVSRPDSATVVNIAQDDTVTTNFALHPFSLPVFANISGTVTDSVSDTPVAGAFVAYFHTMRTLRQLDRLTGFFGGFPHERMFIPELGYLHGVAWAGKTDSLGHYTAHLPVGPRYIAASFKPGYEIKFFQDKITPVDADRITFSGDTSGIDFALIHPPVTNDSISGSVVDSAGAGIPSHIMLVRLTAVGPRLVRYRMTDSLGNYAFHHVIQGNFFVRAIPVDGFLPAWYSGLECGVKNWHNADTVKVRVGVSALGVNICVKDDSSDGFATISGSIHGSFSSRTVQGASDIQGVTVQAVSTTSGNVVAYDVSESDGSFSIDNLPPGSYSLVVDKEGYSSSGEPTYTVDETNGYTVSSGSIGITPEVPLSVGQNNSALPLEYRLEQSYPNPFNPTTEISYALPENSLVVLKIYNIIGQALETIVNEIQPAGHKKIQFDASRLPSGIYFYRIEATSTSHQDKGFLQTKKMVLIK